MLVNEDAGAEFLVVEGVDELFHDGYADGIFDGEFDVEGGELDFRVGGRASEKAEGLTSTTHSFRIERTRGGMRGRTLFHLGFPVLCGSGGMTRWRC